MEPPDKTDMTERQKALHQYSLHQDSLAWSRLQWLLAIQTGVLGAMYFLSEKAKFSELIGALGVGGAGLTVLFTFLINRDLHVGRKTYRESGFDKESHWKVESPKCAEGSMRCIAVCLVGGGVWWAVGGCVGIWVGIGGGVLLGLVIWNAEWLGESIKGRLIVWVLGAVLCFGDVFVAWKLKEMSGAKATAGDVQVLIEKLSDLQDEIKEVKERLSKQVEGKQRE